MGSVAERHYIRQEGDELLERGCAVYNTDVDDDAFSCRTDHTTVKASNVRTRRLTVCFCGIGYGRISDGTPTATFTCSPRIAQNQTVGLVVANTLSHLLSLL